MTKEKLVTIKMNIDTAKAVQEVLISAQKNYTYDEYSVPPRITNIRKVIEDINSNI